MSIEARIMDIESKRAVLVDYINEYKKYNKEYNTDEMDFYIERAEEAIANCDMKIKQLQKCSVIMN